MGSMTDAVRRRSSEYAKESVFRRGKRAHVPIVHPYPYSRPTIIGERASADRDLANVASKQHRIWEWILSDPGLGIREQLRARGWADVTAAEIRALTGEQPRLLCKHDSRSARPPALAGLTVTARSNGIYRIFEGDGFKTLPSPMETREWPVDSLGGMESLCASSIADVMRSEVKALTLANACGIVGDFLGRSGPMPEGTDAPGHAEGFTCQLPCRDGMITTRMEGMQFEIDKVFETEDAIYIVEMKARKYDDFNVRQLYVPYMNMRLNNPNGRKPIRMLFVFAHKGAYHLYLYDMGDPRLYGDLRLIKTARYETVDTSVESSTTLNDLVAAVVPGRETPAAHAPFPQADSLERVEAALTLVGARGRVGLDAVGENLGVTRRQAAYYMAAGLYLRLVTRDGDGDAVRFSDVGRDWWEAGDNRKRKIKFAKAVLRLPTMNAVLREAMRHGETPDLATTRAIIAERHRLTGQTLTRRARTARAWCRTLLATLA